MKVLLSRIVNRDKLNRGLQNGVGSIIYYLHEEAWRSEKADTTRLHGRITGFVPQDCAYRSSGCLPKTVDYRIGWKILVNFIEYLQDYAEDIATATIRSHAVYEETSKVGEELRSF